MKLICKQFFLFLICAALISLISCEPKDSDQPYGNTQIYIPQSTVSGGISLTYLVPSGYDTSTFNYRIDSLGNKVNVYLGVICSGKQQAVNGYSVTVAVRTDTINQLITNGQLKTDAKPIVLLPSSAYSLPSTITVPGGQYASNFYLSIDKTQLKTYAGKKVALCVTIANPSNYTLSTQNNQVIILIDVDALKI